jgi:hypothetical protein
LPAWPDYTRGGLPLAIRHGPNAAGLERMDYLEFIARVTSHIPDKGQADFMC